MPQRRLFVEWVLIGILTSLLVLIAVHSSLTRPADNLIYDWVAPLRAAPADDRILIVEIDNGSLAQLGKWPWPRTVHAEAIERIKAMRPAAMIYDILFLEPGADDAKLARAIAGRPPLFLPLLFEAPGLNGAPYDIRRPVAMLARAAAALGGASLSIDADGQVRRVELATADGPTVIPHLAELAYRTLTGHASPAFARAQGNDGRPVLVPMNPVASFRAVPFDAVLRGEVPASFLTGKLVLVGASAEGLGDSHAVTAARAGRMPGIEIQANLLSSLLADRFITSPGEPWLLVLSILPLWLLLLAFWNLAPALNLKLSLGLLVLLVAVDTMLLALAGIWIPPAGALAGLIIVYPLWGWRRLDSISRFLVREVDQLSAETPLPPRPVRGMLSGDVVAGEADRLHQLIAAVRQNAREREEMLQFLSHDMRAPQAAIITLSQDMSGGSGESGADRLARIARHARHTLRLADDFVQLARLSARTPNREAVDLADCLAQASDIMWPIARATGITIAREDPEQELWIWGDGAALVRAFTNLLDNAIRYSPKAGRVICRFTVTGGWVNCALCDEGPGLSEERRAQPFARFGSVGEAPANGDRPRSGAGLGLAFVQTVARRHGGDISYADREGGGACFVLRLPLADPESLEPD